MWYCWWIELLHSHSSLSDQLVYLLLTILLSFSQVFLCYFIDFILGDFLHKCSVYNVSYNVRIFLFWRTFWRRRVECWPPPRSPSRTNCLQSHSPNQCNLDKLFSLVGFLSSVRVHGCIMQSPSADSIDRSVILTT